MMGQIFALMAFLGAFTFIGMGFSVSNSIEAKESKTASNIMIVLMLIGIVSFLVGFFGLIVVGYDRSVSRERREELTQIINGDKEQDQVFNLAYDAFNGEVKDNGNSFIIIRGWVNLTGTGANNFPESKAIEIQDSLAQFIIKTLS